MIALLLLIATVIAIGAIRIIKNSVFGIIMIWVISLLLSFYLKYFDIYVIWVVMCVTNWLILPFYLIALVATIFFYIKFRRNNIVRVILMSIIMILVPPIVYLWVQFKIVGLLKAWILP